MLQRYQFRYSQLVHGQHNHAVPAICSLKYLLSQKFRAFYLGTHNGRRLTWQTNMGNADIKATFGNVSKHELNVSTYQMCVLMLFNSADALTYREIEQATSIPASDLKRCLQSLALVKGKQVLRKEPMSRDIGDDDNFCVNDKFKVKIGTVVAQNETDPEKLETRQRVEEDRKPQIEAAIVRIMKSRRVLDHNSIMTAVAAPFPAKPRGDKEEDRVSHRARVPGEGQDGQEAISLPHLGFIAFESTLCYPYKQTLIHVLMQEGNGSASHAVLVDLFLPVLFR
jgi:hypothetical protein